MEITCGLSRPRLRGAPDQNENSDPKGVDILFGDELMIAS